MYMCPNCKRTYEKPSNFCAYCGSAINKQPIVQEQPNSQDSVQPQYVHYYRPASTGPAKAKVIVGMVLSIVGFGIICFLIYMYFWYLFLLDGESAFSLIFPIGIFSPAALVGFIMSNNNRQQGDTSNMSKVGKSLGLLGFILSLVLLIIAICCIGV